MQNTEVTKPCLLQLQVSQSSVVLYLLEEIDVNGMKETMRRYAAAKDILNHLPRKTDESLSVSGPSTC